MRKPGRQGVQEGVPLGSGPGRGQGSRMGREGSKLRPDPEAVPADPWAVLEVWGPFTTPHCPARDQDHRLPGKGA